MPRKSTGTVPAAVVGEATNGEVTRQYNAYLASLPTEPVTTASLTEPISPSRTKSGAQPSKSGAEKAGRKSIGNAEPDEGVVEKAAKSGKPKNDDMTIDDLLLPRSLISRLSRGSLPPNTSLQKDALLALTKSATVFISYLAHTANSLTSRKTIQAADVLEALREMELQGITGLRLEQEILLFDEGVKGKRKGYRDRVKARESTGTATGQDGADDLEEDGAPPQSKRARRADEDIDMDGAAPNTKPDDPDADPSAQLMVESAQANRDDQNEVDGNDQTESDADVPVDEDEEDDNDDGDGDDDQEDEPEDEEDEANEDNSDMDEEQKSTRKKGELMTPNGRVEIGSDDDESD